MRRYVSDRCSTFPRGARYVALNVQAVRRRIIEHAEANLRSGSSLFDHVRCGISHFGVAVRSSTSVCSPLSNPKLAVLRRRGRPAWTACVRARGGSASDSIRFRATRHRPLVPGTADTDGMRCWPSLLGHRRSTFWQESGHDSNVTAKSRMSVRPQQTVGGEPLYG